MSEVVEWFREAPWFAIALVGVAMNVSVTLTSVGAWLVLHGRRVERRQLSAKALSSAVVTTLVNGLVLVPAWWLWQQGTLQLPAPTLLGTVLQFAYLALFMDTALYWLHRAGHNELVYRFVHERHHEEAAMTPLSLFVMHPIEAAGFGFLMMCALVLVPVSVPAIAAFGTLNVVAGTLAHQMAPEAESPWSQRFGGWATFHQAHHQDPAVNLGFFIPLWDRVAGTSADT